VDHGKEATMATLYSDDKITLDDEGLTIAAYYFPIGTKKRMAYGAIKKIEYYGLTTHTGKYKYWGGNHRYWLNLDWKRHDKATGIILCPDGWWRPIITPERPAEVLDILEKKTGLQATPERPDDKRPER
jgi:hypothetical protein